MWLTDLADACRKSGLPVDEEPAWRSRGHGPMAGSPKTIVLHHTAGPKAGGDLPSLGVVRDGRSGLPGPLAQLMLSRSGRVRVIAAGLCYHAGVTFSAEQANSWAIGIEAEHDGVSPWPELQYAAYLRLVRALMGHYRIPVTAVLGHKEVAKPLGRKTDPSFSTAAFRSVVARSQEDEMELTDSMRNFNGDTVQFQQVVVGTEQRVADAQVRLSNVENKVNTLNAKLDQILTLLKPKF